MPPIFSKHTWEGKSMNNISPVQNDLFASLDATPVKTNKIPAVNTSSIPTLAEFAAKHCLRLWPKDHTRKTNMTCAGWFDTFTNQIPITEVSRKHIYDFVDHLMATRGIVQCTGNKYMAALSRVMSYAYEREVVTAPIKLKYPTIKSERPRFYSRAEQAELIRYLREDCDKDWMADMVILSCATGMRRGEILAIQDKDVVLSPCENWLFLPARVTKGNAEREVPLNSDARAAYERLMNKEYVEGKTGIKCFSHRTFYRNWNKSRRDVGKGDPLWLFHVCRHTAASRLANDVQLNEFAIADILGHADTRTTRRYVHSRKSVLHAAVSQI